MLVTDDEAIADRCRRLRNHGQDAARRFVYLELGWNARMDEIAAAYLSMKLASLDAALARRTAIAGRYDQAFAPLGDRLLPLASSGADRACYAYAVRVQERDRLQQHLLGAGVETQPFHPVPLHLQPGFAGLGYKAGAFPVAEQLGRSALALPLYAELEDEEVEHVTRKVVEFYG